MQHCHLLVMIIYFFFFTKKCSITESLKMFFVQFLEQSAPYYIFESHTYLANFRTASTFFTLLLCPHFLSLRLHRSGIETQTSAPQRSDHCKIKLLTVFSQPSACHQDLLCDHVFLLSPHSPAGQTYPSLLFLPRWRRSFTP